MRIQNEAGFYQDESKYCEKFWKVIGEFSEIFLKIIEVITIFIKIKEKLVFDIWDNLSENFCNIFEKIDNSGNIFTKLSENIVGLM